MIHVSSPDSDRAWAQGCLGIVRLLLIGVTFLAKGEVSLAGKTDTRLNVVFILADDLGWSDTTLYGTTRFYETPNIERLARRGMLFTNAYTAHPLCSPTRSSIMTGLDPARTGFTSAAGHIPNVVLEKKLPSRARSDQKVLTPKSVSRLDAKYTTLAETIRAAGYVTGHFGKWHLGREPYTPLQHGFDIDVPHCGGPGRRGRMWRPGSFRIALISILPFRTSTSKIAWPLKPSPSSKGIRINPFF